MTTLLAGDVGGTKTLLGLFDERGTMLHTERLDSRGFTDALDLIAAFFELPEVARHPKPTCAALGIAGPVLEDNTDEGGSRDASGEPTQRAQITNLPYAIDTASLIERFGFRRARLYNDFYIVAAAVASLAGGPHDAEEIIALNPAGKADPRGAIAVLGAGTGLGEALIARGPAGTPPIILPTEGGHTDFAPRDAVEIGLLQHLSQKFPEHVSVERVVCGVGLVAIYEYLREIAIAPERAELRAELDADPTDAPAILTRHALDGTDVLATVALDRFVMLYGAEAGNLALKSLATGGVYLAGGIAAKILPKMTDGVFLESFQRKGRFAPLLRRIPIYLLKSPTIGLRGAAHLAAQL